MTVCGLLINNGLFPGTHPIASVMQPDVPKSSSIRGTISGIAKYSGVQYAAQFDIIHPEDTAGERHPDIRTTSKHQEL
jgi:hypothetical protein